MTREPGWLCVNDQYCIGAERFESVAEFEAIMHECFPVYAKGMELHESSEDGQVVVRDEDGEMVLMWVGGQW